MKRGEFKPESHGVQPDGYNAHRIFVASVPHMADMARDAAHKQAHSYRNFRVGAAGLFLSADHTTTILSAGNLKKRGKDKVCAEKKLLGEADKYGFTELIGLVVTGTTDRELIYDVTGKHTPTLHCCGDCLNFFLGHALIKEETPIVSTGLKSEKYQIHTYKEMRDFSVDNELADAPVNQLDVCWEEREALFNRAVAIEKTLLIDERRSPATLAKMVLDIEFTLAA